MGQNRQMGYYSATRKKEILPFATTWVNLEGSMSMLSEISQRQILYDITLKKFEHIGKEGRMVVARNLGVGEIGEAGKRVQTFSYKMNKV